MNLRVANVTEEGRLGGPQYRIVEVAEKLRRLGIDTIVVCPERNAGAFHSKLEEAGVEWVSTPLTGLQKRIWRCIRWLVVFIYEVVLLRRVFQEKGIDLVHCNGAWQIKAAVAARTAGVPVVWHLNDTSTPEIVRGIFKMLAGWAASGFIVASRRTGEYYLSDCLGQYPSIVIPAPVDTDYYAPVNAPRRDGRLLDYETNVVTVATINPLKGLETFIRAAELVIEQSEQDVGAYLVGPIYSSQREYGARIRRMARNAGKGKIHLTGYVEDVRSVLLEADLYICSSRHEASPMSVWEALSMKVPVVSTDVGDIKKYLEVSNGRWGYVTEVGDYTEIAEKVLTLIDDSELRRRCGRSGREFVKSALDIDRCVKRHAAMYRQVVEER